MSVEYLLAVMIGNHRSLLVCYAMAAFVVWSSVVGILNRAADPTWAGGMTDVRRNYDVISALLAVYALIVSYGILRRREWGRVLGVSLAVICLVLFIGTRLLAPAMTSGSVSVELGWEAAVAGVVAAASIFVLLRQRF